MGYGGKQASRSGDVRRFNFTGNGSNTAFDLGFTPATQNQLIVTINGGVQHYDAFSVSGSTINFTGTPAAGDAIQVTAVVDTVGVAGIPNGAIANVSSLAVSGAATFANTTTHTGAATFANTTAHTGLATFDSNVGVGTSSPAGLVGAGKTLAVYNNSHATISIQAADVTNDRNATLELLSSGNGGSLSQIIYGDTDATPGTTSPLVIAGYHNGTRTERMRINANGYITKPYQPMASVYYSTTGSTSSGIVKVTFDVAQVNVGNCYSTSTGRLTAPVAGNYRVTAFGMRGNYVGTANFNILVNRNGAAATSTAYNYNETNGYGHASASWIVPCSTNDYLEVYMGGGAGWYGNSLNGATFELIG